MFGIEVGASLVLVQHLRPGRLDCLRPAAGNRCSRSRRGRAVAARASAARARRRRGRRRALSIGRPFMAGGSYRPLNPLRRGRARARGARSPPAAGATRRARAAGPRGGPRHRPQRAGDRRQPGRVDGVRGRASSSASGLRNRLASQTRLGGVERGGVLAEVVAAPRLRRRTGRRPRARPRGRAAAPGPCRGCGRARPRTAARATLRAALRSSRRRRAAWRAAATACCAPRRRSPPCGQLGSTQAAAISARSKPAVLEEALVLGARSPPSAARQPNGAACAAPRGERAHAGVGLAEISASVPRPSTATAVEARLDRVAPRRQRQARRRRRRGLRSGPARPPAPPAPEQRDQIGDRHVGELQLDVGALAAPSRPRQVALNPAGAQPPCSWFDSPCSMLRLDLARCAAARRASQARVDPARRAAHDQRRRRRRRRGRGSVP